jgi:hypothetical protein
MQDLLGKFIFSMGSGSSSKPASTPAGGAASSNPAALK